jgi:hypothetical protein
MDGALLKAERSLWSDVLDPLVGVSTLLIAVVVWWNESRQEWRNSLPKRLTVDFVYKGRLVMRCEDADLASEGDIRALGQQIGGQMAAKDERSKPEQLLLKAPTIRYSSPRLTENGAALCYHASFELMALPEKLANLETGQYWHWVPPFEQPKISATHD